MAASNRERVGNALDVLRDGLRPFVERELESRYKEDWLDIARQNGMNELRVDGKLERHWDTQGLLKVVLGEWMSVFEKKLGRSDRNLVHELIDTRNRWAHQEKFSTDDAYRAMDSVERLLHTVAAPEAQEIEKQKHELLRQRYDDRSRRQVRQQASAPVEGRPSGNLKPWREIVTPHPDVASGHYQQAEFAADLNQVYQGIATNEYGDPEAFFARTFLTDGLQDLLKTALRRLDGSGGEPIVKLQTNFGGGKTHAMLALYHLFAPGDLERLTGIDAVLSDAGVERPSKTQRAVLVGSALGPGQIKQKPDGLEIRTMWGEMAWQLLGNEGYQLVADADLTGTSPGSDTLRELFSRAAPCLVLIDEWVTYLRQLVDVSGLPAGSFDANYSFAQALTEAIRAVPGAMVVASLPASDIEIGGEAGQESLVRLQNVFGRMEAVWRPASTEESFEIVRRRLFQPIADSDLYTARDAVVRSFGESYRSNPGDFPLDARDASYERRMQAAYPIHPELFDRLYEDWSSLERFQRTRGVLRLMAKVIHALWERDDRSLLILPATVPIDEPDVREELTRYLEDHWMPVIEQDVDGPQSLPLQIDQANPNLGRYSATRRVSRTVYMGSAPKVGASVRGIDDQRIRLGCTQPGESVAIFGDALRRLTDQATFLYVDNHRYWFSTQPSVTRVAQDRAVQQSDDRVFSEIAERLRREQGRRGDFARVHAVPGSSGDVPDEHEARLVILGPEFPHVGRSEKTPAREYASKILETRGNSPRTYRNTLVFLAPDQTRLAELVQAVRFYLAWKSIAEQADDLNLDAFQRNQARSKHEEANRTVDSRIPETYSWLLVPEQPEKTGPVEWEELRATGEDRLAVRASRRLRADELLLTELGPLRLKHELDRIPLWREDDVSVKQLCEDFATYLYLPRLQNSDVLLRSIADGIATLTWNPDTFAYAGDRDQETGRYRQLVVREHGTILADGRSLVVKPEEAQRQLDADEAERRKREADAGEYTSQTGETGQGGIQNGPGSYTIDRGTEEGTETGGRETGTGKPVMRRFYGETEIDPLKVSSTAGQLAQEIIQHLEGLPGSKVRVKIEIEADMPEGAPDHVIRTVTENANALQFRAHAFEEE